MFRSGLAFFGPGRFGMIKPVDPTDPALHRPSRYVPTVDHLGARLEAEGLMPEIGPHD